MKSCDVREVNLDEVFLQNGVGFDVFRWLDYDAIIIIASPEKNTPKTAEEQSGAKLESWANEKVFKQKGREM